MISDPQPPAVFARLELLTTTTPPLADPLERIVATVRTAQCPTLGTDSRVRLLMDAVELLTKVVGYQQEQIGWLVAEVAALRGERG